MRKRIIASVGIAVVALGLIVLVGWLLSSRKFELSSKYRGSSGFETIDVDELKARMDEGESFAVFVYQPACRASDELEEVVRNFSEEAQIKFLKVAFAGLRDSGLVEGLKYYPSVVLYHDGKVVSFLRADADEDLEAYQSGEGFAEWWDRYVKSS